MNLYTNFTSTIDHFAGYDNVLAFTLGFNTLDNTSMSTVRSVLNLQLLIKQLQLREALQALLSRQPREISKHSEMPEVTVRYRSYMLKGPTNHTQANADSSSPAVTTRLICSALIMIYGVTSHQGST